MSLLRNPSAMSIRKELAGGHKYELSERVSDVEFRTFLKPDLLTNLFNPVTTPHDGTSFQWDVVTKSLQKVGGKSYSEDGPSLVTDVNEQRSASIPAFGLTYELSAEDVIRRRKAGSYPTTKEAISDLMADQSLKMMDAYDIFNEDAMVELIVNDRNIVAGGPFQAQEWHNVYEGTARPAATALNLAAATPEQVRDKFNEQIDRIDEELKKRGLRAGGYIHICGKTMFNGLVDVETALGQDYDIRPTLNLKIEQIPSMQVGNHRYRNFTSSQTGVMHIQYKASMDGATPLIGENDGYLIPIGVENMFTIELAPDVTLDSKGELAEPMYMYYEETRHELRVASATNRLYRNTVPAAISAMVATA